MPRHLRFARAVALLSGLGACGAPHAVSAGPIANPPTQNRNAEPTVTPPPAPPPPILTAGICDCACNAGDPRPACAQLGSFAECCDSVMIEGPLPPPDLPG